MSEQQYELNLNVQTSAPARRRRRTRPASAIPGEESISKRKMRVNDRNRVMIARYYYWTEIRRRRFDDVMSILSEQEFFIEERTISNAILDLSDYLDELYDKKKDLRELKKEYPNWNWEVN